MSARRRHVFGPVPSRRLGRSLGADLVPYKTCTLDCVYCQCGRTTQKTADRLEYAPTDIVLQDIREALENGIRPDAITLSGSGEPTLHSGIGEILRAVRKMTRTPLVVITNSTLLGRAEVRTDCAAADIVIPSLDAGDSVAFESVNRPHESLDFDAILEGLVSFRSEFSGKIWLEVMVVGGMNEDPAQIEKIASHVARIRPDKVQINTVVRPPAEPFALPVPEERLRELAARFPGDVEILARFRRRGEAAGRAVGREDVLALLARRPCTLEDVAQGLRVAREDAERLMTDLEKEGSIRPIERDEGFFFVACREKEP
jgi:wyosine [tRNA(Phe)-imidazoG37] synthetase (radical SAM superfamily)